MFHDILRGLVEQSGGGIGAVLMGYDGIAIDEFFRDGTGDELSRMTIEYTATLKEIKQAAQVLNTGAMEEVSIRTGKHQLIVRSLNEDYFVALTLEAGGNFGRGRFLLMRESYALREALS
jgi:predicted regulator of Ras-like GTPase activity (Roadblock/LC7/MglB family)